MARPSIEEKVYEQALKVFSKYGYKKTTLADIGDELGITNAALYKYSNNKADLYYKAVKYGMTKWQSKVKKAVEKETDILSKFYTLCNKSYKYLAENKVLRNILVNDPTIFPMTNKDDRFKEINEDSENLLKQIIIQGINEGIFKDNNPDTIANLLFSIYKMFIIETYIWGEQDPISSFNSMIKLLTEGLLL